MKRKCLPYKNSTLYKRHVCIDAGNGDEILSFLTDDKIRKKFDYIVNRILEQKLMYYDDYVKLDQYDDLSEIRIFPNGLNARLYCKEVKTPSGDFYVVAAKLLPKKKSEDINKEIDQFIKPIETYDYEF